MKRPSSTTPAIAASMRSRIAAKGVVVSNSGTAIAWRLAAGAASAQRARGRAGAGRTVRAGGASTLPRMSIGIVGLGYVGLPLAVAFAEAGRDVVALDV